MSVRKATALRCQTVYIGSLDLGGAVTTNVAIAQIINVDNDYIGLDLCGSRRLLRDGRQSAEAHPYSKGERLGKKFVFHIISIFTLSHIPFINCNQGFVLYWDFPSHVYAPMKNNNGVQQTFWKHHLNNLQLDSQRYYTSFI
ncbi:Uncharacterised protein [Bacteroides uniformis]|jgi:hypothetical protein|uniref:Uncharacterized protein n=1 Tax=Bacteroides uniformis TaxID=820 RepID=A0A174W0R0_BACUN|nr:Uncharacterised protein [Bacteroides uniformis]